MAQIFKKLFGLTLKGTIVDADRIAIKDSAVVSGETDKNVLASVLRTYILKPLLDATFAFLNGIKLNTSRIAMQEPTQVAVFSVSGWYTVMILDKDIAFRVASTLFSCTYLQGIIMGSVSEDTRGSGGAFPQRAIALTQKSIGNGTTYIKNVRLAFSNTVSGAGAKLQVEVQTSSTGPIISQMLGAQSSNDNWGWKVLDTPLLENVPLLPDGSAATLLEAGEKYILNSVTATNPIGIQLTWISNDQMRLFIPWGEKPKQGTSIAIDYQSATLRVRGGGSNVLLDNTFTESAPEFNREGITFALTKVAGFSGLPGANYAYQLTSASDASASIIIS